MNRLTLGQKSLILYHYKEGKYASEISEILNIPVSTVKYNLRKNNLKSNYFSYSLNQYYFDNIDNSKKAYILGLIYADGNVYISKKGYVFSIGLSTIDEDMIVFIKNELKYTGPLHYTKNNSVCLQINNKYLVESLIKCGVFQRKSLILQPPSDDILPKSLMKDFIRGYYDGDGCLSKDVFILGTEELCNWIKNYSDNLNINSRVRKINNIYRYTICGIFQIKIFLDSIYNESEVYLYRKYEKYLNLCITVNNKLKI